MAKPYKFYDQMRWIKDNQARYNIQTVLHVGDVVNDGSIDAEWTIADAAFDMLDAANIPYIQAVGNHDYDNGQTVGATRPVTKFNTHFGQSRYTGKSWWNGAFYEASHSENAYCTMTINGQDYLFLSLEFGARDAMITWANGIIAANPTKTVIIVTHSFSACLPCNGQ